MPILGNLHLQFSFHRLDEHGPISPSCPMISHPLEAPRWCVTGPHLFCQSPKGTLLPFMLSWL